MKKFFSLIVFSLLLNLAYSQSNTQRTDSLQSAVQANYPKGNIAMPEMTSTNESLWYYYWEDQLKVSKGNVITPDNSYSDAAKASFIKAQKEYKDKNSIATKVLAYTALSLLIASLLTLFI